jgi:hypothetical protein
VLRFQAFACTDDLKSGIPMLKSILTILLVSAVVGVSLSVSAYVALALIGF